MKYRNFFFGFIIAMFALTSCKTGEKSTTTAIVYQDSVVLNTGDQMTIALKKGDAFNHPTFVIWKEDMYGRKLICSMQGDSIYYPIICQRNIWTSDAG